MKPKPADPGRRGGPTDPSHDDDLRRGIIHTNISRPLAVGMVVIFLAAVGAVPISQAVMERLKGDDSILPDLFKRKPTKENLKQFEDDLEKASYLHEWVQPRMQALLTGYGRAGNRKATVGHDGWLFYKPGVLSVAGPGFLDADILQTRIKASLDDGDIEVHPDPRPAIYAFHKALQARGIKLVLLPMPDKASAEASKLHGRSSASSQIATNLSWARFVEDMRGAGVVVFDKVLATDGAYGVSRFLIQDTHWTPVWMENVAQDLAAFVQKEGQLAPVTSPSWKSVAQDVQRVGDIVDMLKLPEGQTLFLPQKVTVHQVQNADGSPWESNEKGDVLLLGDSFSNIFSLSQMGWGESAGFGPHLARALGRPVDVIAQNDSGAFATRKLLSEALQAGEDRLVGKKVVVWEFASRELAVGDWKPLTYELGAAK